MGAICFSSYINCNCNCGALGTMQVALEPLGVRAHSMMSHFKVSLKRRVRPRRESDGHVCLANTKDTDAPDTDTDTEIEDTSRTNGQS